MIETVVRYLHDARVPFRHASYPSQEVQPKVAHRVPAHGLLVETELLLVGGKPVLACYSAGESIDRSALGAMLGGLAVEPAAGDIPELLRETSGPVPPLGELFGVTTVVDERIIEYATLVFRAFDDYDYFEVPYEDFARLERPRVASFASAGELGRAPRPS